MTWMLFGVQLAATAMALVCLWLGMRYYRRAHEAHRRAQEFLDFAKARAECPFLPSTIVVEVDSTESLH